jgi:hypothetical protein
MQTTSDIFFRNEQELNKQKGLWIILTPMTRFSKKPPKTDAKFIIKRKTKSLKKAQHGKIENVADSVLLSLFMGGSCNCKLQYMPLAPA